MHIALHKPVHGHIWGDQDENTYPYGTMVILRSVIRVSELNTCMVLFGNGTIINLFIYQFSVSFTYGTIQMSVVLYDSKYVLLKPMVLSRNMPRGDPPVKASLCS